MRAQGVGGVILALLLLAPGTLAWAPQQLGVDADTMAAHVEGGWPHERGRDNYCIWLEVDRNGKATPSARQQSGAGGAIPPPPPGYLASLEDRQRMRETAAALRFRPFTWNGEAVMAVGNLCFPEQAVRHEVWLDRPPAFPAVKRWQDVEVGLRRTPCLGSCPAYDVTVSGNGDIDFSGSALSFLPGPDRGVLVLGHHQARIAPDKVRALVEQFREARFFAMRDEYDSQIVDGSFTILWLKIGGRQKKVFDNMGAMVGKPAAFERLLDAVDSAAGTARWVKGDGETVPYMVAQGFDFSAPGVLDVTREAMRRGNGTVLAALAQQPLPFDMPLPAGALDFLESTPPGDLLLGQALVLTALRFDLPDLLTRMAELGWVDRTPKAVLQRQFDLARPRHAQIIQILTGKGVRPTTSAADSGGGNAAFSAAEKCPIYGHPRPALLSGQAEEDMLSCTRELLDRGAKLDRVDATGYRFIDNAALTSLKVTRMLLDRGLPPQLPVETEILNYLGTGHDAIILTLLEAGADPRGKDGTTDRLHGYARALPLPATLEWLDTHGIP